VVGEDAPDRWMPVYFSREAAEAAYPDALIMEGAVPRAD